MSNFYKINVYGVLIFYLMRANVVFMLIRNKKSPDLQHKNRLFTHLK
jgi:hypothetical protein